MIQSEETFILGAGVGSSLPSLRLRLRLGFALRARGGVLYRELPQLLLPRLVRLAGANYIFEMSLSRRYRQSKAFLMFPHFCELPTNFLELLRVTPGISASYPRDSCELPPGFCELPPEFAPGPGAPRRRETLSSRILLNRTNLNRTLFASFSHIC